MEILSKLPVKSLTRFNCVYKQYTVKQNIHLPFFKTAVPSVHGACDGLLCLQESSTDKAAIWNPSTREFKILPPSSIQCPPYFSSIQEDERHFEPHVELYSFRSDSWKEIPSPDGICYWKTECLVFHDFVGPIFSFDMANEKFSILSIPEFIGPFSECYFNLLAFNGSLGFITYGSKGIDLWITSEGIWTKQFCIESISGAVCPLGFGKNDELFLRNTNNKPQFHPSTQELKKFEINTYLDNFHLVRINGI
ncbi:hypothetical protein ES332_A10G276100v1 [Gossypium tomentosum]|uniref:Uncharacterized protein n=1 Tax=Gossypium tomentosum TaxID=34277 RepID=A0A5D2NYF8_GOSTO|nr:hypothetical protein ES332_A10G276100v1 [Gossypium tomentosum]